MPRYLRYLVATVVFASFSLAAQVSTRVALPPSTDASVTSVTGESWLNHLHRSFDETSMGKTNTLGPPTADPSEEASDWALRFQSVPLRRM